MSGPPLHAVLVSTRRTVHAARLSVDGVVRHTPDARVHVADLDGSYRAVGPERVVSAAELGILPADLHRDVVVHGAARAGRRVHAALVDTLADDATVVVLAAGVILLGAPTALLSAARGSGIGVLARSAAPLPRDDLWPGDADLARAGAYAVELFALHGRQHVLLDAWRDLDGLPDDRWLDVALSRSPHGALHDPVDLLTPWNLLPGHVVTAPADRIELDGRVVTALDLSGLDPAKPWLLAPARTRGPRARLSDHPALARTCATVAAGFMADPAPGEDAGDDLTVTGLGVPADDVLRGLYRDALAPHGTSAVPLPPDPIDPACADALASWLTDPLDNGVLGRYLLALHRARPDLRATFPGVPGEHSAAFLQWAHEHGRGEADYSAGLVDLAVRRAGAPPNLPPAGRRPTGINVVGYLRGELGIGESARLMVSALESAHIPYRAESAERHLASRQGAALGARAGVGAFDTSLVCVNADMTSEISRTVPALLARTYRIGMWYWEVEEFPAEQREAFTHVDEVWVATDFVRAAIEPHSPVPVRTVTPPLPQPRAVAPLDRARFGLPDGPLFYFSFDYLSTVERKNPLGLIEAFTRAFAPGDGPVLVLKSINAHLRPDDAERLRVRAASEPDVHLIEDYLDAGDRDALLATCDVYVSLHRAEGLGLTMAEAMALGKPVIATGYSGNMQFMSEDNAFLVPWAPAPIPVDAPPYPAGATWADPDLDAAAHLMRLVLAEPATAEARAARATDDLREHSPESAGRRIAGRLDEIRRTSARRSLTGRARTVARRLRRG